MLPEYGRLKERMYEVGRQQEQVRREKAALEDAATDLSAELKLKVEQLESKLTAVKTRKQTEITEISQKLTMEYEVNRHYYTQVSVSLPFVYPGPDPEDAGRAARPVRESDEAEQGRLHFQV